MALSWIKLVIYCAQIQYKPIQTIEMERLYVLSNSSLPRELPADGYIKSLTAMAPSPTETIKLGGSNKIKRIEIAPSAV